MRHRSLWSRLSEEIGAHVWYAGRWCVNQWRARVTYRGQAVAECYYCTDVKPLHLTRAFTTRDGDEHRACKFCLRLFGLAFEGAVRVRRRVWRVDP